MLNKLYVSRIITFLCALVPAQTVLAAADNWQMNMYKGVTPLSKDMYTLHMIAIGICAVIGVIVFGAMFYSLIYHRKSRGYKAAKFHGNNRIEILWTIVPFLILVGLAIPATIVLIRQSDDSDSDVTVKVVGYQWKWQYQYLDQGISFFSTIATPFQQIQNQQPKGEWYLLEVDKPLVVPINKKIRFIVTSGDVIHSWWVPEIGVKRDAIPGFMHEAWARIEKTGTYRGQCAELCGINHAYMPIVVKAVTEPEFEQWVKEQTATPKPSVQQIMTRKELMQLGEDKYNIVCSPCHQINGAGMPPLFPALKNSSVAVGHPIARHIALILNGVPGSAMEPYKDQLTDKEIAAIVTYERNAWENNTNDIVQPTDVAAVRQSEIKTPVMVKKAQAGGFR